MKMESDGGALPAAAAAEPAKRLLSIDLLDADEHSQLDEWGNRAVLAQPARTPVSIPQLFAAQVARDAEAVAITCGSRSMTYGELNAASNRLAHLLVDRGAAPASVWRCCCRAAPRRSWRSWP